MRSLVDMIKRLHHDEDGAPEMSNVLIVGLIAIPLIIALVIFGRWAYDQFISAQGSLVDDTEGPAIDTTAL